MRMAHLVAMLAMALLGLMKEQSGLATVYYPGDKRCGKELANGSVFTEDDNHVAHRWLPIGTRGFLCNIRTAKCAATSVQDRGPFGAIRDCDKGKPELYIVAKKTFKPLRIKWMGKCYWWQAQPGRLQKGFKYRGAFDVTKPVAKKIELRAFDEVVFFYGAGTWKKTKPNKPNKKSFPVPLAYVIWSDANRMRYEKS